MATEIRELEGTWEEIMEHSEELAGKRVRLTILAEEKNGSQEAPAGSAAAALIPFVGGWQGDDLQELVRDVYENRSQAKF